MKTTKILPFFLLATVISCAGQEKPSNQTWTIDTQADWNENLLEKNEVEISDGLASPTGKIAVLSSVMKQFDEKALCSVDHDRSVNGVAQLESYRADRTEKLIECSGFPTHGGR